MFEITRAEHESKHKNGLAVLFNAQHWVTMSGAHVMLDGDGNVVGGAGGNLKGKQFKVVKSKSKDMQKYLPAPKETTSEISQRRPLSKKENKIKDTIAFDLQNFGHGEITKDSLQKKVDEYKELKHKEESKDNEILEKAPSQIFDYFKKENLHSDLIKSPEGIPNNTKETFRLIGHGSNRWPPEQGEMTRSMAGGLLDSIMSVASKRESQDARGEPSAKDWDNIQVDDNLVQAVKDKLSGKETSQDSKMPENKKESSGKEKIVSKYGSGYWNKKVYGRKGNYSIYLSGKIKKISDEDANELMK